MKGVTGTLITGGFSLLSALVIDLIEGALVDGDREGVNQSDRFVLFATRLFTFAVMTGISTAVAVATMEDGSCKGGSCTELAEAKNDKAADSVLNADPENTTFVNGLNKEQQLTMFSYMPIFNMLSGMLQSAMTMGGTSPFFGQSFKELGAGGELSGDENAGQLAFFGLQGADAYASEISRMSGAWGDVNSVLQIKRTREAVEEQAAKDRAEYMEHPEATEEEAELLFGEEAIRNRTLTTVWNSIDQNRFGSTYYLDMFNSQLLAGMTDVSGNVFSDMFAFMMPWFGEGATGWFASKGFNGKQLVWMQLAEGTDEEQANGRFALMMRETSARTVADPAKGATATKDKFYNTFYLTGLDFRFEYTEERLDKIKAENPELSHMEAVAIATGQVVNEYVKAQGYEVSDERIQELMRLNPNLSREGARQLALSESKALGNYRVSNAQLARMASRAWVLGTRPESEDIYF
ncbi:MAG: hypothetical protein K8I00_12840, partial [Candidatus Omnitrophica bacterium]|nr:hypothetical protein [Candidatus Omnitrophota bacterium]